MYISFFKIERAARRKRGDEGEKWFRKGRNPKRIRFIGHLPMPVMHFDKETHDGRTLVRRRVGRVVAAPIPATTSLRRRVPLSLARPSFSSPRSLTPFVSHGHERTRAERGRAAVCVRGSSETAIVYSPVRGKVRKITIYFAGGSVAARHASFSFDRQSVRPGEGGGTRQPMV